MCGNSKEGRSCPGSTTDVSDMAAYLIFGMSALSVNAYMGPATLVRPGNEMVEPPKTKSCPPGPGEKPINLQKGW